MTKKRVLRANCQFKFKHQLGFTSVEYAMVTLVVFGALFLPFPGSQGMTAVGMLLAGLRNFQMHTTFLLSLP